MANKKKAAPKKQQKKQSKKQVRKQPNAITRYFRETSGELRKVSWPSRAEAWSLTKVVVVVMAVMALLLGGLDFLFFQLFDLIFSL